VTTILAIDPGSAESAWLRLEDGVPLDYGKWPNDALLNACRTSHWVMADVAVIEWMSPRGMPTSAQEFETMYWVGRFAEALRPMPIERLERGKVKDHLCGNRKANDVNIRAALIDRFGGVGGKAAAVGRKTTPGPLYGIAADIWSALALAVTWNDQHPRNAIELANAQVSA
jgi:hypothetical protein